MPPKLAASALLLNTGDTNKNDPNEARLVAIVALRIPQGPIRSVAAEDHTAIMKPWTKRHRELSAAFHIKPGEPLASRHTGSMSDRPEPTEPAQRVARHAERPGFRISELCMTTTQCVGWHCHSSTEDTFYVLEGCVRITLREPIERVTLEAGHSWGPVRAGRPHLVTNCGSKTATFLVLQGFGPYDFVPLD